MRFSADLLCAVLEDNLPAGATGLLVGLSGGADSATLLTALTVIAAPRPAQPPGRASVPGVRAAAPGVRAAALGVRAVHVDHGLQAASSALRAASISLCQRLKVPLEVVAVAVDSARGASIEAAARAARYRAFARVLRDRECLLTAHHAEDQAETLLLQLLRGAGLKGLCAMPPCRPFARGWHLRPLLAVSRRDLRRFGAAQGVAAVEDPMNRDARFDRAYLRHDIWPSIERRWPGAAAALARAAQHLAQAQASLDAATQLTVERLRDGEALSVPGLRALPARERLNVLRYWLHAAAVEPPSSARLGEALRQMLTAHSDHIPAVAWGEHALRRYRQRLFVTPAAVPALPARLDWVGAAATALELPAGLGALRLAARPGGLDPARLPGTLSVRRRRGGEALKTGARARSQSLQHLCQSLGVLPWLRDALPLIYADDALIAVGDLWQDARWSVEPHVPGLACMWENAPSLL